MAAIRSVSKSVAADAGCDNKFGFVPSADNLIAQLLMGKEID